MMFEQTFVQTQAATRRPWTVAVSLSLQAVVVGVILLIPLLHPEVMRIPPVPQVHSISTWTNLAPRPVPVTASARVSAPSTIRVPRLYYPTVPQQPSNVTRPIEVPATDGFGAFSDPVALGSRATLPATVSLPAAPPVKPPAPAATKRPEGPVPVGGDVAAAKLMYAPRPAYPELARRTHSQGTVHLEAIIAADGKIRNLRVLSGPPLLVHAALEAVQQWKYQPTLLNGKPVEVVTEIEVNFTLSH
jgi:protein TonB